MKKMIIPFLILLSINNVYARAEHRSKIAVIDTGLDFKPKHRKYLCKSGHKSYIKGTPWHKDTDMHGTNIFELVAQNLDYKNYCIIVYKWFSTEKTDVPFIVRSAVGEPNNVVKALRDARSENVDYVNMSLSGTESSSIEEYAMRGLLLMGAHIFVAAGNEAKTLDLYKKTCIIYPACYKMEPYRGITYHVVGNSTSNSSNKGNVVTKWEDGTDKGVNMMTGTSQATAIALNKYLSRRIK